MRFSFFSLFTASILFVLTASVPALSQQNGIASLEGTVVDSETQQPVVGAVISVETIAEVPARQRQRIGPTGAFRFTLDPNKNYYLRTEAVGYRYTQEKLIFTSAFATRLYGKLIMLKKGGPMLAPELPAPPRPVVLTSPAQTTTVEPKPAEVSASPAAGTPPVPVATVAPTISARTNPVVAPAPPVTVQTVRQRLRAVQFVQSRTELLPEAQPALDQLLMFLRENPKISIELAGHTDNQGDYEENLTLSKQRVDVVKAFLVRNGVAAGRITSRGYGSTRPIASNNSEATRRLNRRVELLILTP